MLSVDAYATEGMVPEDLGQKGSEALLEEVREEGGERWRGRARGGEQSQAA